MPKPKRRPTDPQEREAKAREVLQRAAGAMFLVGSAEGSRIVSNRRPGASEQTDRDESDD